MKLDKRFILAASLVMGLGLGVSACGGDDGDDNGKKANGETCTVNSDCTSDYCSDGKCAAKPAENKCDKTAADCSKEHQHLDSDACACKCDAGYKLDGDACVVDEENKCDKTEADCNAETETWNAAECKCDPKNVCNLACAGENQEADTEACACKCKSGFYDENKGEDGKEVSCKPVQEKPESCGNKALDEGEVCDTDENGNAIFKAGEEKSCDDWAAENNMTGTYTGNPGCNATCQALSQGSCKADSCGNKELDGDEKCETIDGKAYVSDGNGGKREAVCTDWQGGTATMTGAPSCNDKCTGIGKGDCAEPGSEPESIEGVVSCKSTLTYDEAGHKVSGDVEVTLVNPETKVSGTVLCGTMEENIQKTVNIYGKTLTDAVSGKITSEFDTSVYTTAGDYGCVYFVQVEGQENGAVCSGEKVSKANGAINTYTDKTFTIAGASSEGAIASWSTWAGFKVDETDKKIITVDYEEGSDKTAKIDWKNAYGKNAIKVDGGRLAFQNVDQWKDAFLGHDATTSSHLSISLAELAADATMVLTAETRNSKLVVYAGDTEISDSEGIFTAYDNNTKTGDPAKEFTMTVPKGTKAINIFNEGTNTKAIYIDSIIIK